jgi:hypothetical protein
MRASVTRLPSSVQTAAATESTAKSIDPRRRSFQKLDPQRALSLSLGIRIRATTSSGALSR